MSRNWTWRMIKMKEKRSIFIIWNFLHVLLQLLRMNEKSNTMRGNLSCFNFISVGHFFLLHFSLKVCVCILCCVHQLLGILYHLTHISIHRIVFLHFFCGIAILFFFLNFSSSLLSTSRFYCKENFFTEKKNYCWEMSSNSAHIPNSNAPKNSSFEF